MLSLQVVKPHAGANGVFDWSSPTAIKAVTAEVNGGEAEVMS